MAAWRSLARARLEDGHTQGREWELNGYLIPCSTRLSSLMWRTSFFEPEQPDPAEFWCPASRWITVRVGPDALPVGFRYPPGGQYRRFVPRVNSVIEPVRTKCRAL